MMSGRIKILLAVLAVSAGFSVWYLIGLSKTPTSPSARSASILQQAAPTPPKDSDSDGLSDVEESYWGTDYKNPDTDGDGYTDGEEVLSGHDPAKKGPDDLLNNKANLTQKASSLLLGGLATGDLDPSSPTYEASITALIDQIFEQYDANVSVELDSIVTSTGDASALLRYGITMSRILKSLFADTAAGFTSIISTIKNTPINDLAALRKKSPEQFAQFTAAIDVQLAALDGKARELKAVTVPQSMLQAHKNELIFVRGLQQQYRALRAIDSDPLQGIIAMQMISTLTSTTAAQLMLDFNNRLSSALP